MDRCGELLQLASKTAKHRFGDRATVSLDERPSSFPDKDRWVARVRLRDEVMADGSASEPEDAAKRLVEELAAPVTRQHAADGAVLDRLARVGIGA